MGIQEKAMLEYRKTMKRAKGMIAVLGLCMAVTGTSVSYAAGGTADSGYESSQDAAVGDSADSGGGSFEGLPHHPRDNGTDQFRMFHSHCIFSIFPDNMSRHVQMICHTGTQGIRRWMV